MGIMWEELRASYFKPDTFCWQPGEHIKDRIAGNPDGIFPLQQTLWECKLTYKKIQPVADTWIYMKQILSYLKLTNLETAQLDILWAAGDYSRPLRPIATETRISFTQHEIDSWWQIMRNAAREMEASHVSL